jgi:hypothetical protein
MADLKSVTVEYLRELARKHLGRGHSKLKTKDELLEALVGLVPGLAKLAGVEKPKVAKKTAKASASAKASAPVKKTRSVEKQVQEKVKEAREKVRGSRKAPVAVSAASRTEKPQEHPAKPAPAEKRPLPGDDDEKTPVYHPPRPAEVVTFPPKPKRPPVNNEETTHTSPAAEPEPSAPPEPAHPVQHAAEPLVEGFFVARVAGEHELLRHHLTEAQHHPPREALDAPGYKERLGGLPMDYGDDTVLLLPRDPYTLFLFWDFSAAARQRALEGLESPRAVLRVYDNKDILLRVIDVALESRSYYIHGMPPGHPYRVEVHFFGSNGRSRRIGHSSNRVTLPPVGPSADTSVRFMRLPPIVRVASLEAQAATAPTRTAPIEEREYITWRRVPLPGSGGFEDLPERHRERIVGPGAPGEGASAQPYLEAGRPGGSSEQWAWSGGPEVGSSEQWGSAHPKGGSSERWEWVWTRPGGAAEYRSWSTSSSGQGR